MSIQLPSAQTLSELIKPMSRQEGIDVGTESGCTKELKGTPRPASITDVKPHGAAAHALQASRTRNFDEEMTQSISLN
jgi:hypothetical protein